MRVLMGTTLMLGSRRRGGFSKTARSHRHPRRHPWRRRRALVKFPGDDATPHAAVAIRLASNPEDRREAARKYIESVGGKLTWAKVPLRFWHTHAAA